MKWMPTNLFSVDDPAPTRRYLSYMQTYSFASIFGMSFIGFVQIWFYLLGARNTLPFLVFGIMTTVAASLIVWCSVRSISQLYEAMLKYKQAYETTHHTLAAKITENAELRMALTRAIPEPPRHPMIH